MQSYPLRGITPPSPTRHLLLESQNEEGLDRRGCAMYSGDVKCIQSFNRTFGGRRAHGKN
jgi:hypothetical protein